MATTHKSTLPPLSLASKLQLPPGAWETVFQCLCEHFPQVSQNDWRERFKRSRILDAAGLPIPLDTKYRNALIVHYFREVANEPLIPFVARIAHADKEIVVADKPHFLAVIPAGRFVEETLLRRLMRELDNPDLVPLHRIDRGTAGLVMFSANPATRSRYQALFREQRIEKRYESLAPALTALSFPLNRRSRIVRGEPFFRMREASGDCNSETAIDVIDPRGSIWRYALKPISGRKHQLRVHMAALGAPIVNDRLYPELTEAADDDYARPLKLLARSLTFVDPISGNRRHFNSLLDL